jgi:hypothetical protein
MSVALTHLHEHKGVFAATMGGGSIWYAPDATAAQPEFRMVYRVGPGASSAVFFITPDDRFLVQPIQGVWSPGDAVYNRDYPGEHSRRVIVLDIQKLLRARTLVNCAAPPVVTDANGIIQHIPARNNGAEDCPTVTGTTRTRRRSPIIARGDRANSLCVAPVSSHKGHDVLLAALAATV